MDLRIAISSGCFWSGIGLILAKVMEVAKEIRSDDKKRVKTGVKTPIRRSGWWPGGCWPFWVPERQGGRAAAGVGGAVGGCQVSGAMVCRGWPSGWPAWRLLVVCRGWLGGGDPAAIRRYLISN